MAYNINIVNGSGTENILNGSYSVTSDTVGYDNSSIDPSTLNVVEGTNEYNLTIAATGTLTLHVSEDGTSSGISVVGATFKRTDNLGNEYGDTITSDENGNAVFPYVPFAGTNPPTIYYKQLTSDGNHEFDNTVKSTTLTEQTGIVEVINTPAVQRTFNLTDTNYSGLKLDGQISLN